MYGVFVCMQFVYDIYTCVYLFIHSFMCLFVVFFVSVIIRLYLFIHMSVSVFKPRGKAKLESEDEVYKTVRLETISRLLN